MKIFNYPIIRSLSVLLVGILLIWFRNEAANLLIIMIGILFFIPGLLSLISYFRHRKERALLFPFDGTASLLLGLWLIILPAFFADIFMYLFGAILVFMGIYQIISLISARKYTTVSGGYYVLPALVVVLGLVILANPFAAVTLPFLLIGIGCVMVAFTDMINSIKYPKQKQEDSKHSIEVEK